eukprot:TRINITY_DN30307_c0_g1_i1.p1 TRINITY_DN30307_c0_g1~~TRINITY_DN30307_c0_g1_i1.p1  ORF type:complete len:1387 (+),score=556.14 TRINITY_DN30307_c0_g1_i1:223-4383(+)
MTSSHRWEETALDPLQDVTLSKAKDKVGLALFHAKSKLGRIEIEKLHRENKLEVELDAAELEVERVRGDCALEKQRLENDLQLQLHVVESEYECKIHAAETAVQLAQQRELGFEQERKHIKVDHKLALQHTRKEHDALRRKDQEAHEEHVKELKQEVRDAKLGTGTTAQIIREREELREWKAGHEESLKTAAAMHRLEVDAVCKQRDFERGLRQSKLTELSAHHDIQLRRLQKACETSLEQLSRQHEYDLHHMEQQTDVKLQQAQLEVDEARDEALRRDEFHSWLQRNLRMAEDQGERLNRLAGEQRKEIGQLEEQASRESSNLLGVKDARIRFLGTEIRFYEDALAVQKKDHEDEMHQKEIVEQMEMQHAKRQHDEEIRTLEKSMKTSQRHVHEELEQKTAAIQEVHKIEMQTARAELHQAQLGKLHIDMQMRDVKKQWSLDVQKHDEKASLEQIKMMYGRATEDHLTEYKQREAMHKVVQRSKEEMDSLQRHYKHELEQLKSFNMLEARTLMAEKLHLQELHATASTKQSKTLTSEFTCNMALKEELERTEDRLKKHEAAAKKEIKELKCEHAIDRHRVKDLTLQMLPSFHRGQRNMKLQNKGAEYDEVLSEFQEESQRLAAEELEARKNEIAAMTKLREAEATSGEALQQKDCEHDSKVGQLVEEAVAAEKQYVQATEELDMRCKEEVRQLVEEAMAAETKHRRSTEELDMICKEQVAELQKRMREENVSHKTELQQALRQEKERAEEALAAVRKGDAQELWKVRRQHEEELRQQYRMHQEEEDKLEQHFRAVQRERVVELDEMELVVQRRTTQKDWLEMTLEAARESLEQLEATSKDEVRVLYSHFAEVQQRSDEIRAASLSDAASTVQAKDIKIDEEIKLARKLGDKALELEMKLESTETRLEDLDKSCKDEMRTMYDDFAKTHERTIESQAAEMQHVEKMYENLDFTDAQRKVKEEFQEEVRESQEQYEARFNDENELLALKAVYAAKAIQESEEESKEKARGLYETFSGLQAKQQEAYQLRLAAVEEARDENEKRLTETAAKHATECVELFQRLEQVLPEEVALREKSKLAEANMQLAETNYRLATEALVDARDSEKAYAQGELLAVHHRREAEARFREMEEATPARVDERADSLVLDRLQPEFRAMETMCARKEAAVQQELEESKRQEQQQMQATYDTFKQARERQHRLHTVEVEQLRAEMQAMASQHEQVRETEGAQKAVMETELAATVASELRARENYTCALLRLSLAEKEREAAYFENMQKEEARRASVATVDGVSSSQPDCLASFEDVRMQALQAQLHAEGKVMEALREENELQRQLMAEQMVALSAAQEHMDHHSHVEVLLGVARHTQVQRHLQGIRGAGDGGDVADAEEPAS